MIATVHAFAIRDSLALRTLIGRGISFDSKSCLTQDLHLLRRAVLAPLLPELYPETVILDHNGRASGFAQLGHRRGDPSSRLLFLSPKDILPDGRGGGLIEALLRVAGRRQAQHILADAEDKTEECGFLRREGFSVYARQDIWKGAAPFPQPAGEPPGTLRPLLSSDVSNVHALYCSIVPALVHQVEGFPRSPNGWSIFEEGELVGFFHLRIGSRGLWMEPFFHPGTRHAARWIGIWLDALRLRPQESVYVCVRSYQDWVGSILHEFGFTLLSRRAVLVRRVVVPLPILEGAPLPAVEKPIPQASTFHTPVTTNGYDTATANHR
jgi:hypothetical protein